MAVLAANAHSTNTPFECAIAQASPGTGWVAAAPGGDTFTNVPGDGLLWVKNTHATDAVKVTVTTQSTYQGFAIADLEQVIEGGNEAILGPFSSIFHAPGTSTVSVAYAESGGAGGVAATRVALLNHTMS